MLLRRPAFRAEQVEPAVLPEKVRSFDPDRLRGEVNTTVHDHRARTREALVAYIEPLDPDRAVPLVQRFADRWAVVQHPRDGVVLEEDGRIDAVDLWKPDRVRPRASRIRRGDEKVSASIDERGEEVERSVVILDRRRKNATRDTGAVEVELGGTVEDMADLRPVHEVPAAENRNAGEVGEARRDEIIVVLDANYARVGVEPCQHRVVILAAWQCRI